MHSSFRRSPSQKTNMYHNKLNIAAGKLFFLFFFFLAQLVTGNLTSLFLLCISSTFSFHIACILTHIVSDLTDPSLQSSPPTFQVFFHLLSDHTSNYSTIRKHHGARSLLSHIITNGTKKEYLQRTQSCHFSTAIFSRKSHNPVLYPLNILSTV